MLNELDEALLNYALAKLKAQMCTQEYTLNPNPELNDPAYLAEQVRLADLAASSAEKRLGDAIGDRMYELVEAHLTSLEGE